MCLPSASPRNTAFAGMGMMNELNTTYFKELSMYIAAGKKKLEQVRSTELAELTAKAKLSNLPEDAQAAKDLASYCDRFEKKLHDLELSRIEVAHPIVDNQKRHTDCGDPGVFFGIWHDFGCCTECGEQRNEKNLDQYGVDHTKDKHHCKCSPYDLRGVLFFAGSQIQGKQ